MRKKEKGITLIVLAVIIIVLIILAGVAIALTVGNDGLFVRSKWATSEHIKQEATETMNLKISGIQIESYGETQSLPNLQYLADKLCEDDEIDYVLLESKKEASLRKIDVTGVNSIFTKIKKYPYEFEINDSLQLASIDGVKISETITLTQEQYSSILNRLTALESNTNNMYTNYSTDEQVVGRWIDNKPIYMKTITGSGVSNGKILYTLTDGDYLINYSGFIQVPGSYISIGNYYGNAYTGVFFRRNSDKAIAINCGLNYDSAYALTLYYTKTTDEGNGVTLPVNPNY